MQIVAILTKDNWLENVSSEAESNIDDAKKNKAKILEEEQSREETVNNIRAVQNFVSTDSSPQAQASGNLSLENARQFVDLVTGETSELEGGEVGDEITIATLMDLFARGADEEEIMAFVGTNLSSISASIAKDKTRAKKYLTHLMEMMAVMELSLKSRNQNSELQKSLRSMQEKLSALLKSNNIGGIQEFLKSKALTDVINQSVKAARQNFAALLAATLALRKVAQDAFKQRQLNPDLHNQILQNIMRETLQNAMKAMKEAYERLALEAQKENDPAKRKQLLEALKQLVEMANNLKLQSEKIASQDPAKMLESITKALERNAKQMELMAKTLPLSLEAMNVLGRASEQMAQLSNDLISRVNAQNPKLNPAELADKLAAQQASIEAQRKLNTRAQDFDAMRRLPEQVLKIQPAPEVMLKTMPKPEINSTLQARLAAERMALQQRSSTTAVSSAVQSQQQSASSTVQSQTAQSTAQTISAGQQSQINSANISQQNQAQQINQAVQISNQQQQQNIATQANIAAQQIAQQVSAVQTAVQQASSLAAQQTTTAAAVNNQVQASQQTQNSSTNQITNANPQQSAVQANIAAQNNLNVQQQQTTTQQGQTLQNQPTTVTQQQAAVTAAVQATQQTNTTTQTQQAQQQQQQTTVATNPQQQPQPQISQLPPNIPSITIAPPKPVQLVKCKDICPGTCCPTGGSGALPAAAGVNANAASAAVTMANSFEL